MREAQDSQSRAPRPGCRANGPVRSPATRACHRRPSASRITIHVRIRTIHTLRRRIPRRRRLPVARPGQPGTSDTASCSRRFELALGRCPPFAVRSSTSARSNPMPGRRDDSHASRAARRRSSIDETSLASSSAVGTSRSQRSRPHPAATRSTERLRAASSARQSVDRRSLRRRCDRDGRSRSGVR